MRSYYVFHEFLIYTINFKEMNQSQKDYYVTKFKRS
jgi:hypothetical protein